MATEKWIDFTHQYNPCFLQKFTLYETRSNFYICGRYKKTNLWRVLKIYRLEPSELNIVEDSATYSDFEYLDLLRRVHDGNRSTGGLKLVTKCFGIVGFIKFLEPYYMLLVTGRKKIGVICGHAVYSIKKSEIIPIPHSSVLSNLAYSKNEKRYKKLLSSVDLTKDFFFSYSYNIMNSLQKNLCNNGTGQSQYESMFVWNHFLTRGIRNTLKNNQWTVALVYGFFKQENLSVAGRDFKFTLIARRSRHYAGTRYLKRGVNEKGRVANDVETEQIVVEDVPEGYPMQISSVVQVRGSIPLFWSQETSWMNIKPDIILSKKDKKYEATRLHFENLAKRYGNPIIVLNLIKTNEKKPRETILRAEFSNAIRFINKDLSKENRLKFLSYDLQKHSRKAINALQILGRAGAYALSLTGIFYCQVTPKPEGLLNLSCIERSDDDYPPQNLSHKNEDAETVDREVSSGSHVPSANLSIKVPILQKGVLRTNCIDCLDRTNVAQYAYGVVALGLQLKTLGLLKSPNIGLDNPLAKDLMGIYETMGDTLALQYGGSAAHNKIFCERRGQWRAATQSQEFLRTLQRYYSNTYVDAEKQNAINVFLGHFQPQQGKPALWELDSDQHHIIGIHDPNVIESAKSFFKRSLSDGNILNESDSCLMASIVGHNQPLAEREHRGTKGLSESTPEISSCESDISFPRYTPSMPLWKQCQHIEEDQYLEFDPNCFDEHGHACNFTNFLDLDWLSSSGNSCEDVCDRSVASDSGSSLKGREPTATELASNNVLEYDQKFVQWVTDGELLFR
ncbi:phosphoinositide phosphatase SAC2 [Citrus sinensis]|uniref:Phosphoinositide phosphatase SAC2 n=2 Tax=Citrus sinensis TaxID=2711 RepID=A0ACB8J8R0_CITSI|nr:phosphoinositide phosphatase SAC2 [Citrus sinensis]